MMMMLNEKLNSASSYACPRCVVMMMLNEKLNSASMHVLGVL